jgi:aspartate/methionine/tyrosine aminotransferase
MFSARTRWDRTANRLARAVDARRRSGKRLLDLTGSNPTRAGIPYPSDLLTPLGSADGLRYDPDPRGQAAAREAVAADFARRGAPVSADRVLLTASTSEAYALLFKLLCDPGDSVLVPRPGYPLFEHLAGLESVRVDHYPLEYDGRWRIDVAAVEQALGPHTRAIVSISPNNPTGSFTKRDEAKRLRALGAERGLALVSDEVFADYAFGDDPRRAGSLAEDGPGLAFALGGLSKSCGLPQLKLAWLAASGPADLREEAMARLEIAADAFLSVATPVQNAAPALLGRSAELRAPIRERVRRNRVALAAALERGSPASALEAEGGWYAVLRVPDTIPEEERAARLVADDGVLVHPGHFYDFPRAAHLVLSLLTPPGDFSEGVDLLLERLVL